MLNHKSLKCYVAFAKAKKGQNKNNENFKTID